MIVGLFVEKPYNYCRHYYNLNLINIINIVFYRIILDLKLPTTWLHTNSNTNTSHQSPGRRAVLCLTIKYEPTADPTQPRPVSCSYHGPTELWATVSMVSS